MRRRPLGLLQRMWAREFLTLDYVEWTSWIRTHRNLVPNSWHKFVCRSVRPCFHQIVQRARKRVSKKLLEWSYPRNWGSFVWNEEGRSEYILSLPISSPGWLHSYLTLLLQLSFIRCAQPPVVSRRLLQETATTTATPGPRPRYTEAVHSLILNQEPWTHGTMLLGRGGSPPCPSPTLAWVVGPGHGLALPCAAPRRTRFLARLRWLASCRRSSQSDLTVDLASDTCCRLLLHDRLRRFEASFGPPTAWQCHTYPLVSA